MIYNLLTVLWKEPLTIMWKGMLSIFIVAAVVFLSVVAMNKATAYFAAKKSAKLLAEVETKDENND